MPNVNSFPARCLILFCVLASTLLLLPQSFAQTDDELLLTFGFDKEIDSSIPAFIYAKGELVGSVPGSIEIAATSEPVPIEIGIPQMDVPLYSFVFDPTKATLQQIDAATSVVSFGQTNAKVFWDNLSVEAPRLEVANVKVISTRHFEITLPTSPFISLVQTSVKWGITTADPTWTGYIPSKNYTSDTGSIKHLTFSKSAGKISALDLTQDQTWSGALPEAVKASLGFGMPLRTETWTVKSTPEGAAIWTDRGHNGSTNMDITVEITAGTIMILKLAGYVDCPREKCKEAKEAGRTEYTCKLKRIK